MLDLKWGVLMAGIVVDMKTWRKVPQNCHDELISMADGIQKNTMSEIIALTSKL